MDKFLKILVSIGAVLVTAGQARAQLDNRAFFGERPGNGTFLLTRRPGPPAAAPPPDSATARAETIRRQRAQEPPVRASDVALSLHAFTFFKNNEYFGRIADGYTLFGTQLNPQLVYQPTKNLRLEAGIFLWKDFGTAPLRQVRPTFRATWSVKNHQFILGNIRPHLHHGYIEPLLNFERVMLNPLEEGVQYRYLGTRLFLDVWVDWQRQQYRFSNFQEEIAGGLSGSYALSAPEKAWQLALPFQLTATHRGGQIDTVARPLQTLLNAAAGLRLAGTVAPRTQVRFSAYALGFQDRSSTFILPFRRGTALYLNTSLDTRHGTLLFSYFEGHRFIAPLGGDLFQGLSRTVADPSYAEAVRRVLLLRLLRDFRISDAAALTVRLEPVYDFRSRKTDFSFGFYLNFRQDVLLGNATGRTRP